MRRTPALDLWRQELRYGARTPTAYDDLWRGACEEMNALEAEANGLTATAAALRREAHQVILNALRQSAA